MSHVLSRRTALKGSAALLGLLVAPVAAGCSDGRAPGDAGPGGAAAGDGSDEATTFWAVIADRAMDDDPTIDRAAAAQQLGLGVEELSDPDSIPADRREQLAASITTDFTEGRTVEVAGWLLARTEVLIAVVAAGRRP